MSWKVTVFPKKKKSDFLCSYASDPNIQQSQILQVYVDRALHAQSGLVKGITSLEYVRMYV